MEQSIKVENQSGTGHGVGAVEVDGVAQASGEVTLKDDGATHQVRIVLK